MPPETSAEPAEPVIAEVPLTVSDDTVPPQDEVDTMALSDIQTLDWPACMPRNLPDAALDKHQLKTIAPCTEIAKEKRLDTAVPLTKGDLPKPQLAYLAAIIEKIALPRGNIQEN